MASSATDILALLPALQEQLASSSIAIPDDTLYGAITHFLAHLPPSHLPAFAQALSASPIWDTRRPGPAVRLAVTAKLQKAQAELHHAWFGDARIGRAAREWLNLVTPNVGRAEMAAALLQGLDDVADDNIGWRQARVHLEEKVVVALAVAMDETGNRMLRLVPAIPHIDTARLRVLDLKTLVPRLHTELFASLGFPPAGTHAVVPDDALASSRALARAVEVLLEGGPSSQSYARDVISAFCARMEETGATLAEARDVAPASTGPVLPQDAAALESFTYPAQVMIDDHIARADVSPDATALASQILSVLATFSSLPDTSAIPGHQRLLHSTLDVLGNAPARDASRAVTALCVAAPTPPSAAFALLVAEQLVHSLTAEALTRSLGLAEQPDLRAAFERAHALVVSVLAAYADRPQAAQSDFVDALLAHYAPLVLRQHPDDLSVAFMQDALPTLVQAAAKVGDSRRDAVLLVVSNTSLPIRIALVPAVPRDRIAPFLESLAADMERVAPEQRQSLNEAAHKAVLDMSDECKGVGVEWWMRWRRRLVQHGAVAHL